MFRIDAWTACSFVISSRSFVTGFLYIDKLMSEKVLGIGIEAMMYLGYIFDEWYVLRDVHDFS